MKRLALFLAISSLGAFAPSASANSLVASLSDWCFNVNGNTDACNLSMSSNSAVNLAGFDTTIGLNSLGTAVVNLGAGNGQKVGIYVDYDIRLDQYGSFNDAGSANGMLAAGQSYSINDPSAAGMSSPTGLTLFDAFTSGSLDNMNNNGTPGNDPQCCNVAFAMFFNVDSANGAIVTFSVSSMAPQSGFFLKQLTNGPEGDALYLSGDVQQLEGNTSGTPEPSTFLLGAGAMAVAGFFARRKRAARS